MTPATTPMIIDGTATLALSGSTFDTINPATGDVLARLPEADADDADAAVAAAERAATGWAATTPADREAAIRAVADAVEAESDELALLDARGSGNPISACRADIANALLIMRYMAGLVYETKGSSIPVGEGIVDYTIRQPFGVVARILPFNHPLAFTIDKISAPLTAGNCVIVKPSPFGAPAAVAAAKIAAQQLPPGVLNLLTDSAGGSAAALVRHPGVKRIALTGSVATAQRVMADSATAGIKSFTFELGGKNPLIVFPDVELDAAADAAVVGMNLTRTLGQSCGSTSRAFVHRELYDAFVDKIAARLDKLTPGLPEDPATQLGTLASATQLTKTEHYVATAAEDGARLVCGGRRPDDPALANGFFYLPTLFADVTHTMRIARDEIFGPVLSVIAWDDESEMLRQVNDVSYGLTANIWTNDLNTAHRMSSAVQAGYVWVNGRSGRHFFGAPFGGWKNSGVGVETSTEELLSYTELKNISIWPSPTAARWSKP